MIIFLLNCGSASAHSSTFTYYYVISLVFVYLHISPIPDVPFQYRICSFLSFWNFQISSSQKKKWNSGLDGFQCSNFISTSVEHVRKKMTDSELNPQSQPRADSGD